MRKDRKSSSRRSQEGIALLIAIFVLLLISVVAIALLVSSGTETALGANYRSSSTVYYAALAGLEEARGRLLPKNSNYLGNINPSLVPTPFPLGQTTYVINANAQIGETVAPWDNTNQYYDQEYASEFTVQASSASWQSVNSVWNNNATPGPMYKWVRINAVTEKSLYMDVNQDTFYDPTTLLFYDPAHLDSHGNPMPSLIVTSSPPSTAVQALEITALAYLPDGSKKILQYLVAPTTVSLSFPAALTLDGSDIGDPGKPALPFSVPTWAGFYVNGNDQSSPPLSPPPSPPPSYACSPTAPVYGIGYTNSTDGSLTDMTNTAVNSDAIGASNHGNYKGFGDTPSQPNVNYVGTGAPPSLSLASNLLSVSGLNSEATTIMQNADVVITGTPTPATQAALPAAMSPTNPMSIAVNGDLNLSGWSGTGYGLLLVTGTFTFDPNATWNGIVLVIGQGIMNAGYESSGARGQINGAVLVARTLDTSGNPLPPSSPSVSPSFKYIPADTSQGIYYNSCWVQYVQSPFKYRVLSFHEIPQS